MENINKEKKAVFSVITVCYNAEKVIRETIDSVLKQTWNHFEYIIVDGASTDKTVDIIGQYAGNEERIFWHSEPDEGIFNAMNKGVRYATGDFLIFMNAGDAFHSSDVLEKAAELAEAELPDIMIGDVAFKLETGLSRHQYAVGKTLAENLEKGNNVCHQVIFASKESLKEGFDEHFPTCADYDWLCRQMKAGRKTAKLDIVVTDFDIHGVTGQAKYQKLHWREYFEILEKYFPQPEFKYGEEIKRLFVQERKGRYQYMFMNRWLSLKQKDICISTFFERRGIGSIAIYGVHFMGERLYDELKESQVEVAYAIDRSSLGQGWDIPVIRPEDKLEQVDAVVITPVFDFLEIKDMLSSKLDCPMFSIEEVLFYEYGEVEKKF